MFKKKCVGCPLLLDGTCKGQKDYGVIEDVEAEARIFKSKKKE